MKLNLEPWRVFDADGALIPSKGGQQLLEALESAIQCLACNPIREQEAFNQHLGNFFGAYFDNVVFELAPASPCPGGLFQTAARCELRMSYRIEAAPLEISRDQPLKMQYTATFSFADQAERLCKLAEEQSARRLAQRDAEAENHVFSLQR